MIMAVWADLDFGSLSIVQTCFLLEFDAPLGWAISKRFVCRNLKMGPGYVSQNLKFQMKKKTCIQNELILSQTAPSHDLPVSAECHLVSSWAGCWGSAEMDPLGCAPILLGCRCCYLYVPHDMLWRSHSWSSISFPWVLHPLAVIFGVYFLPRYSMYCIWHKVVNIPGRNGLK